MAFFDDLKEKAVDLGRAGVAKSKQLAEITKLNLNNAAEEDAIKKAYIEIGKLYYAERGMAPEAAYVALCEKVTASKITIEENKARAAELKNTACANEPCEPPVQSDVPPEEPGCDCGCGCDIHVVENHGDADNGGDDPQA